MPDPEELLPRRADPCGAPMTARRYLSLYGARADGDDYFSSDLTDAELAARLGHMAGTPTLVAFSLAAVSTSACLLRLARQRDAVNKGK